MPRGSALASSCSYQRRARSTIVQPGFAEQPLAVGMGGHHRTVARQCHPQRLGEAVHRIGSEHAGAGAAGRTGRLLHRRDLAVAVAIVGRHHHRVDQVEGLLLALHRRLACLHRPAGDEDGGDVEAQRRHQHAGRDLVAVGDAHQRVGAMGVDHVFDGIGNQLARGQRIEHAAVTHGDAVVDGDGVELLGHTASRLDLAGDELAEVLQVDMARHELGEAVGNGDDRLAEVAVLHARRPPQAAGTGHVAAMGGGSGTICRHRVLPDLEGGQTTPLATASEIYYQTSIRSLWI